MGVDPDAAPTIWPWWPNGAATLLKDNTLLAGANMPTYLLDAEWSAYGQAFTVVGILEPTGTALDDTMVMTAAAARRLAAARAAKTAELRRAGVPTVAVSTSETFADLGNGASSVLVTLRPGADPDNVAARLATSDSGLDAVAMPSYARNLRRLFRSVADVLSVAQVAGLALAGALALVAVFPRRVLRQPEDPTLWGDGIPFWFG